MERCSPQSPSLRKPQRCAVGTWLRRNAILVLNQSETTVWILVYSSDDHMVILYYRI
jgi:hypothetical protein